MLGTSTLGEAVIKTRLDTTGLRTGLQEAQKLADGLGDIASGTTRRGAGNPYARQLDEQRQQVRLLINEYRTAGGNATEFANKLRGLAQQNLATAQSITNNAKASGQFAVIAGTAASAADRLEGKVNRLSFAYQIQQGLQGSVQAGLYRLGPTGAVAAQGLGIASTAVGGLSLAATGGIAALAGMGLAFASLEKRGTALNRQIERDSVILRQSTDNFESVVSQINAFGAGFEEVAEQFNKADITRGVTELVKAGRDASETFNILEVATKVATIENENLNDVALGTSQVLRQFKLDVEEAGRAGDVLTRGSLEAQGSITGLITGLSVVGPVAALAGLSLEETVAALVQLDQKGQDYADIGATALRSALTQLVDPTEEAKGILGELGVTAVSGRDKFLQLIDAMEAGKISAEQLSILFDTRAVTAVANLDSNVFALMETMNNAGGELDELATEMADTLEAAEQRAKTAWANVGIAISEGTAGMRTDIANWAADVGNKVEDAIRHANRWVTVWTAISNSSGGIMGIFGGQGGGQATQTTPQGFVPGLYSSDTLNMQSPGGILLPINPNYTPIDQSLQSIVEPFDFGSGSVTAPTRTPVSSASVSASNRGATSTPKTPIAAALSEEERAAKLALDRLQNTIVNYDEELRKLETLFASEVINQEQIDKEYLRLVESTISKLASSFASGTSTTFATQLYNDLVAALPLLRELNQEVEKISPTPRTPELAGYFGMQANISSPAYLQAIQQRMLAQQIGQGYLVNNQMPIYTSSPFDVVSQRNAETFAQYSGQSSLPSYIADPTAGNIGAENARILGARRLNKEFGDATVEAFQDWFFARLIPTINNAGDRVKEAFSNVLPLPEPAGPQRNAAELAGYFGLQANISSPEYLQAIQRRMLLQQIDQGYLVNNRMPINTSNPFLQPAVADPITRNVLGMGVSELANFDPNSLRQLSGMGVLNLGPDGATDESVQNFKDAILGSSDEFAMTVVDAAGQVGNVFTSIISGQATAGGVVSGLGGAAAGIVGTVNPLAGAIIGTASGFLGGLFDAFGKDDEERKQEALRNQNRQLPTLSVTFNFDQYNQWQGQPSDPENVNALADQSNEVVKTLTQYVLPTLKQHSNKLGLT